MKTSTTFSISVTAVELKKKLKQKGVTLNEKVEQLILNEAKANKLKW